MQTDICHLRAKRLSTVVDSLKLVSSSETTFASSAKTPMDLAQR